jgi:hypothetical protein
MNGKASSTRKTSQSAEFFRRVIIALLAVLSALPVTLILAFFSMGRVYSTLQRINTDLPVSSTLVIIAVLVWVVCMFVLTQAGRFMPFLIVLSIPLVYWFAGFSISALQLLIGLFAFGVFLVFSKYLHRAITPLLALLTVLLAYGLYLFPPLQPAFTSRSVAVLAWFINLLLCWTLLSVAFNLMGSLVPASRQPAQPVPVKEPEKPTIQQQLERRIQFLDRTKD